LNATFLKSLLGFALAAVALPALAATSGSQGTLMPPGLRLAVAHSLAHERTSPRPLGDASSWVEQEVTADDGNADDVFGFSVAIDGDTALIGAAQGAAAGTGSSNGSAGAVYVFTRKAQGWIESQKLTADDGVDDDQFGYSIALQGSTAVIGAAFAAVGTNTHQGAVYVFTKTGDTWSQAQKLTADDGATADQLGWSVALDGDTAVLGAPGASINGAFATGAAYVFTQDSGTWSQTAKLTADDGVGNDDFGFGVAVNGTTAIITALNANAIQGAAYVFTATGTDWTQGPKLLADDGAAGDSLGYAVAFDGTTALIGAPFAADGGNLFQGAVYAFGAPEGDWVQTQKLVAAEGLGFDVFGISISLSDNDVVITAPFYNASQGEAFLFSNPTGTEWTEQHTFQASDAVAGAGAAFGYAAAVSHGNVVVGSVFNFVGNNEKQGAAYFYASDRIFADGFDAGSEAP